MKEIGEPFTERELEVGRRCVLVGLGLLRCEAEPGELGYGKYAVIDEKGRAQGGSYFLGRPFWTLNQVERWLSRQPAGEPVKQSTKRKAKAQSKAKV